VSGADRRTRLEFLTYSIILMGAAVFILVHCAAPLL
jgi:hypothetical protein